MRNQIPPSSERRSFLTSLNAGIASLAAMALGSAATAHAKSVAPARFEAARHDKDDWLEKPAKHRLVFDTIEPAGFGEALAFAFNYISVNGTDYGVSTNELAVVIVARNRSTPFAYNDAMWAKYGKPMAARARFEDPKTKQAPTSNLYNSADYGELLPNRGGTLDILSKQGVQLAVCSVATRNFAGAIAQAVGGNAAEINSELIANLQSNARMVPAGIVATSRAQERGYTLVRS
jgi:intracellular sulfur oxidation DsrE/DsrF family protein